LLRMDPRVLEGALALVGKGQAREALPPFQTTNIVILRRNSTSPFLFVGLLAAGQEERAHDILGDPARVAGLVLCGEAVLDRRLILRVRTVRQTVLTRRTARSRRLSRLGSRSGVSRRTKSRSCSVTGEAGWARGGRAKTRA
jgi:hypothetical protein